MSCYNKVFAFVSVLVIIFCTSCALNGETSTTSNTTALQKIPMCAGKLHILKIIKRVILAGGNLW